MFANNDTALFLVFSQWGFSSKEQYNYFYDQCFHSFFSQCPSKASVHMKTNVIVFHV